MLFLYLSPVAEICIILSVMFCIRDKFRPFITVARLGATKLVLGMEFGTFQPFQHISDVKYGLLHGAFDESF